MQKRKLLFVDRDGTLIIEPADNQIDQLEKLQLVPHVIPALLQLKNAGYEFIMISNQDGLGTTSFPSETFEKPQQMLLSILSSQGIEFADILICPHLAENNCDCRKPKLGLVASYLTQLNIDWPNCYVIGDRPTDVELAEKMKIKSFLIHQQDQQAWNKIVDNILNRPRQASCRRTTNETDIEVTLNLDSSGEINIATGLHFLDHMLAQLAKHAGISLIIKANGDLHIDEHHTVEDTALTLGETLRQGLGDKRGIQRYGFVLPMDESLAQVAVDLSGRAYLQFNAAFQREKIGDLPTELIQHFFYSLAQSLAATIHIQASGENSHHQAEAIFKGFGKTLQQAIMQKGHALPTTKGSL